MEKHHETELKIFLEQQRTLQLNCCFLNSSPLVVLNYYIPVCWTADKSSLPVGTENLPEILCYFMFYLTYRNLKPSIKNSSGLAGFSTFCAGVHESPPWIIRAL